MFRSSKNIFILFFSLLFVITLLFPSCSEPVWAEAVVGGGEHADPATFEKNFCLSIDQKEYTITECEKVVSEILKPGMSDLEKYYTLAIWANIHVVYDWDFWDGSYNFDYYSHQWDSYGAMKKDEKSVCVGIAIFYSDLCHAAGLPCRVVRFKPEIMEHTLNYIPNINDNAYYVDVTENVFLMSDKSDDISEQNIDKAFAHITKDCTEATFDYRDDEGSTYASTNIKDCYKKPYRDWFREYALHEKTTKLFDTPYVEKGSGTSGTHYASYQDDLSNYGKTPGIWFLDDFYKDPAAIQSKVLNKEFDEQLLNVSGLKKNYDCDSADELKAAVEKDISVKYFPSSQDGKIVAKSAELTNGVDFEIVDVKCDEQAKSAVFTVKGIGEYSGTQKFYVKMHSAAVAKAPVHRKGLVYNGSSQKLVEPGEAECGEMLYALGTKTQATENFTPDIPTAVDAGRYYVWYKAAGDAEHEDSQPQCIERGAPIYPQKIKLIMDEKIVKVGETIVVEPKIEPDFPAIFTLKSYSEEIASVTKEGAIKGIKEGDAAISVGCKLVDPNPNYETPDGNVFFVYVLAEDPVDLNGSKVVLSESAFTYDGEVQKPEIKTIKGLKLTEGIDYTAEWSDGSSENVGSYTITITGRIRYTGVTKATYRINPTGTTLKTPGKAKKAIKVKWKKQSAKMAASRITGYQIQLATNKKFTKDTKTVNVKGYKKVSKKVKGLKGGKKYYVKIRTYKTVNGTRCYSAWSGIKAVKTGK